MNYLETLYFIGKCLTLSHEEKNRSKVLTILKNEDVNWESVVKVSTAHLVFPALYCNLKDVAFLHLLPKDLVQHMVSIYHLNHNRNLEIIAQAKEINILLLENNIIPIFLKGTSFLIENLYGNIGERMVGDIDFLVDDKHFVKTVKLLKVLGYNTAMKEKHIIFESRHYPRMVKKGSIAAIEIHDKVILNKYSKNYNYNLFLDGLRKFDNFSIPSIKNQIVHNCINKQFSDQGSCYKSLTLRNSYDLLKLSLKENTLNAIKPHKYHFNLFSTYIGASKTIFDADSLVYEKNLIVSYQITLIFLFTKNPILLKLNKIYCDFITDFKTKAKKLLKLLYKKEFRSYYYDKINKRV